MHMMVVTGGEAEGSSDGLHTVHICGGILLAVYHCRLRASLTFSVHYIALPLVACCNVMPVRVTEHFTSSIFAFANIACIIGTTQHYPCHAHLHTPPIAALSGSSSSSRGMSSKRSQRAFIRV